MERTTNERHRHRQQQRLRPAHRRNPGQAGHTVFATMRDAGGRNAKAAQELKAFGAANANRVHVVELDVTNDASVAKAIDAIAKQVDGAIDVLVNNAGRFSAGVQEAFTIEEIKALFETNVFGPLRVNRAVLPHMRKRRSGLIVNTSSVVGRFALPTLGTYSASKYAVEALSEAQRDELKGLASTSRSSSQARSRPEVGNNGSVHQRHVPRRGLRRRRGDSAEAGRGLDQLFAAQRAQPAGCRGRGQEAHRYARRATTVRVVVDKLTGDPCVR